MNSRHETEMFDRYMKESFRQCISAFLKVLGAIFKCSKHDPIY